MLAEEHRLLREALRDFASHRLAPLAAEWDRNATFPQEALKELAALGTFGIAVPEEYGGAGMDYSALAVALEEIAAGDGSDLDHHQRQQLPGVLDPDGLGQRGAEAALPGAAGPRRVRWARSA